MKYNKIFIMILLILLSGCSIIGSDENSEEVKLKDTDEYNLIEGIPVINQLWEKEMIQINCKNVIYYESDIIVNGSSEIMRMGKNGEIKWKSYIEDSFLNRIFIYNNNVWYIGYKTISAYSLETGERIYNEIAIPDDIGRISNYQVGVYNNKIYFTEDRKLDEFRVKSIFTLMEWDIDEKKITRTYVLPETDYTTIQSSVSVKDGLIYFSDHGNKEEKRHAEIIAISVDSFEKVWSYKFPDGYKEYEYGEEYVQVGVENSNYIFYNEKIIVPTSDGLIAFNKETGEVIWSTISPYDVENKLGTSYPNGELLFDEENERIFYMSGAYDYNYNGKIDADNREENIFCIDINTGDKIWAKGTGFTETGTPALYNGYLYIPSGRKMLITNPDTGELVSGMWYEDPSSTAWCIGFIDGLGFAFGYETKAFKPIE